MEAVSLESKPPQPAGRYIHHHHHCLPLHSSILLISMPSSRLGLIVQLAGTESLQSLSVPLFVVSVVQLAVDN